MSSGLGIQQATALQRFRVDETQPFGVSSNVSRLRSSIRMREVVPRANPAIEEISRCGRS
jgi:hypothetical protein